MICADLECLVTSHKDTNLAGLFVLEQSNVACSSLFPLFGLLLETEQFGAPVRVSSPSKRCIVNLSVTVSPATQIPTIGNGDQQHLQLEKLFFMFLASRCFDNLGELVDRSELRILLYKVHMSVFFTHPCWLVRRICTRLSTFTLALPA
jgi:hypothetical protein